MVQGGYSLPMADVTDGHLNPVVFLAVPSSPSSQSRATVSRVKLPLVGADHCFSSSSMLVIKDLFSTQPH